jgi:RNA polymerase sigma-70 factor (ECF subfamily)
MPSGPLSRGLALLPENLREPLVLSAIENLPHHEIAAILNTTTRAIDNRVQRARHRLNSWWSLQP